MKPLFRNILAILFFYGTSYVSSRNYIPENEIFIWNEHPVLPPASENMVQKGLANAFSGILDGKFVVDGGANLPDSQPWEVETKT